MKKIMAIITDKKIYYTNEFINTNFFKEQFNHVDYYKIMVNKIEIGGRDHKDGFIINFNDCEMILYNDNLQVIFNKQ